MPAKNNLKSAVPITPKTGANVLVKIKEEPEIIDKNIKIIQCISFIITSNNNHNKNAIY